MEQKTGIVYNFSINSRLRGWRWVSVRTLSRRVASHMLTDVWGNVRGDFSRAVAVGMKSQQLTPILLGENVHITMTDRSLCPELPSFLFHCYSDPYTAAKNTLRSLRLRLWQRSQVRDFRVGRP